MFGVGAGGGNAQFAWESWEEGEERSPGRGVDGEDAAGREVGCGGGREWG